MVVFSFLWMTMQRVIATVFTSDRATNTYFIRKTKFYCMEMFGKPKIIAANIRVSKLLRLSSWSKFLNPVKVCRIFPPEPIPSI